MMLTAFQVLDKLSFLDKPELGQDVSSITGSSHWPDLTGSLHAGGPDVHPKGDKPPAAPRRTEMSGEWAWG